MNDMQKKHNESLRQTNDNQSEQIAVLDASSRKLKDELSAAKDAATNAETKVTKLGEECESLEKEKAKLEESIDSYRYSMLDEPEFYMLSGVYKVEHSPFPAGGGGRKSKG